MTGWHIDTFALAGMISFCIPVKRVLQVSGVILVETVYHTFVI